MKPTNSSAAKYLIVVFLILIIFGITAGLFVNFSKVPLLKSVNKIVKVQNDFTKLDTCIFKLYNAENSCRMYVVSGERVYYHQFIKEIGEISLIMDSIEQQNQSEKAISADVFDNLIKQKKDRTNQFIELKMLSDSLINFSIDINKGIETAHPKNKLFTTRQFKSIVKIDTIKPEIIAQSKKKFFQRLKAAINDKGVKGADNSKSTTIRTEISADTAQSSIEFNNKQLKEINGYYLKLYATNKQLKGKEKELLEVNHKLITTIVNGLKKYKSRERDYYSSVEQLLTVSAFDTVENLDRFTWFLLALATGLLLFVFTPFIISIKMKKH